MIIRTPVECQRVKLRQFKQQDYENFKGFMLNENIEKHLSIKTKVTEERVNGLFQFALNCYTPDAENIVLAIADVTTDVYVGLFGIAKDFNGKDVQVYFAANEEFYDDEYEVEVLRFVLPAIKRQNTLVKLYCHKEDDRLPKIAEKAGMSFVGEEELSIIEKTVLVYKY